MKILSILLCALLLTGCASSAHTASPTAPASVPTEAPETTPLPTTPPTTAPVETDPIESLLASMTTEEKVGQLFLARCDASVAAEHAKTYHLGGYVLFARDFEQETPDSLRNTLSSYRSAAKIPLLIAVDEEGGTVTRASRYPAFRDTAFPSPRICYATGGMAKALENEEEICAFLSDLTINVNLGPVCDITTDPNAFMYSRSLGQDPAVTSEFIAKTVRIMDEYKVGSALKHFPGYGNNTDTHVAIAIDDRPLETLESNDLLPFAAGIEAGCGAIMVSHTFINALDPDLPASLSPKVHHYLRRNMGFEGVIITDDLVMQAITDLYGAGEAAVLAVIAGNDLLCSTDYTTQYEAVLAAVKENRINADTLDNAVRRVLTWKQNLNLL